MNKKMTFLFVWLGNVLSLLLLILMPKTSELYPVFSFVTLIMIFDVPLILIIVQSCLTYIVFKEKDICDAIPNVGSSLIMLLTFVKFIGSIEKMAIPQMVTILMLFVCLELLLGYLKITYKEISLKKSIWLDVATYVLLALFFMCAMIISVDFGLI